MQSRFSLHLRQGSLLTYLPCAAPELTQAMVFDSLRPPLPSLPARPREKENREGEKKVEGGMKDPCHLGTRIQPPRIQSRLACRHVMPRANHSQLSDPCSRRPHKTCHPMPNTIQSGSMVQWRQSVSGLLRVKTQASRGHTIRLGQFQKYHPARTYIRHAHLRRLD